MVMVVMMMVRVRVLSLSRAVLLLRDGQLFYLEQCLSRLCLLYGLDLYLRQRGSSDLLNNRRLSERQGGLARDFVANRSFVSLGLTHD